VDSSAIGLSPTGSIIGIEPIFVWDGNYYALAVTERLGVEESGGMVRVGIAHYNTAAEVDRLLAVINIHVEVPHVDYPRQVTL
jgi:selenocysteine lyase/cysteine desulfurase